MAARRVVIGLVSMVLLLGMLPTASADPPQTTAFDLNPAILDRSFATSTCVGGFFRKVFEYTVHTEKLVFPPNNITVQADWRSSTVSFVTPPHLDGPNILTSTNEVWIGGACQLDALAPITWSQPGGGGFTAVKSSPMYYPRWLLFTRIATVIKWIARAGIPMAKSALENGKPVAEFLSSAVPLDPANPTGNWEYAFSIHNRDVVAHNYSENLFGTSGTVGPGSAVPVTFTGPPPCGQGPGAMALGDGTVMPIVGIVPSGCGGGDQLEDPPGGDAVLTATVSSGPGIPLDPVTCLSANHTLNSGTATGAFLAGHMLVGGTLAITGTASSVGCESVATGTGTLALNCNSSTAVILLDEAANGGAPNNVGSPTTVSCSLSGSYARAGPQLVAELGGTMCAVDPSSGVQCSTATVKLTGLLMPTVTGPCAGGTCAHQAVLAADVVIG